MTESMFMPCDVWSELLSSSPGVISESAAAALNAHLASCPPCLFVRIDDNMIGRLINKLPPPDFGVGLPPRLKRLLEDGDYEEREKRGLDAAQQPTVNNVPVKAAEQSAVSETTLAGNSPRPESPARQWRLHPEQKTYLARPESSALSQNFTSPTERKGEDFRDKVLRCRECGNDFTFTAGEQEFYQQKSLMNQPGRCPKCRVARRSSSGLGSRERGPR
jgi:hypothetical protein